jgi:hypothetical protein
VFFNIFKGMKYMTLPRSEATSSNSAAKTTDETLEKNPPILVKSRHAMTSHIGAVVHSATWLRGSYHDTVLKNPFFKPEPLLPPQSEIAIYCVHGTADRSYAFNTIANRLLAPIPDSTPAKNLLPTSVSTIVLSAFAGRAQGNSISFPAKQLHSKIVKNKHKYIIILTHSRGFNVASYLKENLLEGSGITVLGIVGIGPALNGSPLAWLFSWMSSSVAEMKPGSQFLRDMHLAIAKANLDSHKYFYIGGEKDAIVPMEDSYFYDKETDGLHSHSISLLERHGHLSLMRSQQVVSIVSDCLYAMTNRVKEPFPPHILNVKTAIHEIEAEIIAISTRTHIWSTKNKVKILNDLKTLLLTIESGYSTVAFSAAASIGEFIKAYLDKPLLNTEKTAKEILMQKLSFNLFYRTKPPESWSFMQNFIEEYKDVSLPPVNVVDEEKEVSLSSEEALEGAETYEIVSRSVLSHP